jgi:cytochrome c
VANLSSGLCLVAAAILGAASFGCSSKTSGASEAQMANARAVGSTGAVLWERKCQSCHGENGAGTDDAPAVLGEDTLIDGKFYNAQELWDYVARKMPKDAPGSLDMAQYWHIVTFIAGTTGRDIPERLSEGDADKFEFVEQ